jgi:hypothetical protein
MMGAAQPLNTPMLVFLVFLQVLYVTMVYGPIAAFLVESFPARIRYTSLSLPYHFANGWFGGFTPLIATSIVAATGNPLAGLWSGFYPQSIPALIHELANVHELERGELRAQLSVKMKARDPIGPRHGRAKGRSTFVAGAALLSVFLHRLCRRAAPSRPAQGLHLGRHGGDHRSRLGRPTGSRLIRVRAGARVDDRRSARRDSGGAGRWRHRIRGERLTWERGVAPDRPIPD